MPRPRTVSDEERERRRGGVGTCQKCGATETWTEWAQAAIGEPYEHLCDRCRRRKWMIKRYGIDTDSVPIPKHCQLCETGRAISPFTAGNGVCYFLCRPCITAAKCMKSNSRMAYRMWMMMRGALKGGVRRERAEAAGAELPVQ